MPGFPGPESPQYPLVKTGNVRCSPHFTAGCIPVSQFQPEDDQHNEQKHRYGQIFIGKHIVNPDTADMLTAFFGFDNAVGSELVNKIIPHVSQRRFFIGVSRNFGGSFLCGKLRLAHNFIAFLLTLL